MDPLVAEGSSKWKVNPVSIRQIWSISKSNDTELNIQGCKKSKRGCVNILVTLGSRNDIFFRTEENCISKQILKTHMFHENKIIDIWMEISMFQ